MKKYQNGFGAVGILAVVMIIGLLGAVGWLVYDRQNKPVETSTVTDTEQTTEPTEKVTTEDSGIKTINNISYTIPEDWKNAEGPFEDSETGNGQYLLSPDYEDAGGGQLSIVKGAFIHFTELEWDGIDQDTTVSQAAEIVKNSGGGYFDAESVNVNTVLDSQVVMFNSGHTTDGVTVLHKTDGNRWLEISFSTVTGGDGEYNAQDSPYYDEFMGWIETFIKLNK